MTMGDLREPLNELTACGLPEALEVMGERWSFMILRASFNGLHHFEEFLSELGIARNILSNRLAKLVEHGILDRQPCASGGRSTAAKSSKIPCSATNSIAYRLARRRSCRTTDACSDRRTCVSWCPRTWACAKTAPARDPPPVSTVRLARDWAVHRSPRSAERSAAGAADYPRRALRRRPRSPMADRQSPPRSRGSNRT